MNLQSILDKWHITTRLEDILYLWSNPRRKYHGKSHLDDLIQQIQNHSPLTPKEREMLFLIALFHDCVYDPQRSDNEEQSAAFFLKSITKPARDADEIAQCILDTKTHKPSSPLSALFCEMDMDIVRRPLTELKEWERGIAHEYSFLQPEEYRLRRVDFLEKMVIRYPENAVALRKLIYDISRRPLPNN